MRKCLALFMLSVFVIISARAEAMKCVGFINPGRSDESYWLMVSAMMAHSAKSLGYDLEVRYAERNLETQYAIALEFASRARKPDAVICVNERLSAPRQLEILDKAGIKTLLILNDLIPSQKAQCGSPGEIYPNWVGTLVPDNKAAGIMLARALLDAATGRKKSGAVIAVLSGDGITPASVERNEGLADAMKDFKGSRIVQSLVTNWTFEEGYEKTRGLLLRYPGINVVWCANDPLALGAVKAIREAGKKPGSDIFVGGINWSKEGLDAVEAGDLVCSVGGHFLTGALAIVYLDDYFSGRGPSSGKMEYRLTGFDTANALNVAKIRGYLFDKGGKPLLLPVSLEDTMGYFRTKAGLLSINFRSR